MGDNPDAARDDTLLLAEPASVDGGEITDEGYNQRAVLTRRAGAILEDDASTEWISCAG